MSCLPGVFSDGCRRRPNSCTNSTAWWFQVPTDSMATGMKMWLLSVFGLLVACRLVSCRPCCGRRVIEVGVGIGVWYCDIQCQRFTFCPGQQRGTIWTLAIVMTQACRLFHSWNLSSLKCPPQDVDELVVMLMSWTASATLYFCPREYRFQELKHLIF